MASQMFIIQGETAIIALTPTVQNLMNALEVEAEINSMVDGTAGVYKENSDVWVTLAINATALARELTQLATRIDTLR